MFTLHCRWLFALPGDRLMCKHPMRTWLHIPPDDWANNSVIIIIIIIVRYKMPAVSGRKVCKSHNVLRLFTRLSYSSSHSHLFSLFLSPLHSFFLPLTLSRSPLSVFVCVCVRVCVCVYALLHEKWPNVMRLVHDFVKIAKPIAPISIVDYRINNYIWYTKATYSRSRWPCTEERKRRFPSQWI